MRPQSIAEKSIHAFGALAVIVGLGPLAAHAQETRIDVGPGGTPANGRSAWPVVSLDGRYIAFVSFAMNLVPGDGDGACDVFRVDRQTGSMIRVDIPRRVFGDYPPSLAAISHDGRYALFTDDHSDWVAGDTNRASDVFRLEFPTGEIRRVSVGQDGVEANGASSATGMSIDGRFVAFESTATNLGPPAWDNGRTPDIFIRDIDAQETRQVTRNYAGGPANGASTSPQVSPDGEWVTFLSTATNLRSSPDTNGVADVYVVRWRTGETIIVGPRDAEPSDASRAGVASWDAGSVAFSSLARNLSPVLRPPGHNPYSWDRLGGFVSYLVDYFGIGLNTANDVSVVDISLHGRYITVVQPDWQSLPAIVQHDRFASSRWLASDVDGVPHMSADGRLVVFERDHGIYARTVDVPSDGYAPGADGDGDTLPDDWEQRFGLNPTIGESVFGPDGDPDGDGLTNAQELAARTHPRGYHTRYFAEGASGSFFHTRLTFFSREGQASVVLRFLKEDGTTVTQDLVIGRVHVVETAALAALDNSSFSTIVESNVPLVIDRVMWWDATGFGSHSGSGVDTPSDVWHFAEGSTAGPFDLFYLLLNPHDTPVSATLRFIRPSGLPPIEKTYLLAPTSRTTINVGDVDDGLAATDVAGTVTSTQPIVVERAMYVSRPGELFAGGHVAAGVPAPELNWYFAEGTTGRYFDTFVVLYNPSDSPATALVSFKRDDGYDVGHAYPVAPRSRAVLWVDKELFDYGRGPFAALENTAVWIHVEALWGVPIVAERVMWWPDGDWHEGHVSTGAQQPGQRWVIANAEQGGPRSADTYLLIGNSLPQAGRIGVTVYTQYGLIWGRVVEIGPYRRISVPIADVFGELPGPFSLMLESQLYITVEAATYWDANGVPWAAGTSTLGTRLPYYLYSTKSP